MAKETSIDELTRLTANGFVSVTQQIGNLQHTVDNHTIYLSDITTRVERIEATMLELAYK